MPATTDHPRSRGDLGPIRPEPREPSLGDLVAAFAAAGSPEWDAARCRQTTGVPSQIFFSNDIADINRAKCICRDCPLAEPCLRGALEREEPCGVWGGYLFEDGRILARKRPRGRPPKNRPAADLVQLPPPPFAA